MRKRLATMALAATVAVAGSVSLAACVPERPSTDKLVYEHMKQRQAEEEAAPFQPEDWTQIGHDLYEMTVTTTDGQQMRCLRYSNYNQGGLDCQPVVP